jgi:hypothetical protein
MRLKKTYRQKGDLMQGAYLVRLYSQGFHVSLIQGVMGGLKLENVHCQLGKILVSYTKNFVGEVWYHRWVVP